ncbi:hypothetical protein P154DRAFT_590981 [Amniculicola lignicola CBS 123094]|uniref:Uncharacterized protein n=1 Tax=Amniculicola lignicola CBS 123094 TaxID=1392246 RepID=A0A6A5VUS2_9PLEO|nr:hypothetical protein P154DRAFT_590981 [Amniculicola lignicola CBS 123094]
MAHGRSSPSKKPLPLEPRSSSPQHIEGPSTTVLCGNEIGHDEPNHPNSPELQPSIRRSVGPPHRRPKQPRYDSKSDLERLLDDSDLQIKEKDEEIQSLKDKNEELMKVWRDTAANLADTKVTISHTLEDGFFIGTWQQLQYDIRNWSIKHFSRAPVGVFTVWYKRDLMPSKHLSDLTPYWKSYLSDDILRPLLVQALVWSLLQKFVFAWPQPMQPGSQKPGGAYWAYEHQGSVASINANLMKPKMEMIRNYAKLERADAAYVKEYFAWRVATAAWIHHSYAIKHSYANQEARNTNTDDLVRKIKDTLSPFTDSVGSVELGRIISHAVHLDFKMWLQKAFFHPARPRWINNGQSQVERFHPDTMELHGNAQPDKLNPNPEITLVISPCLSKSGNSDGENYGVFNTIVKAQVSCEARDPRQEYPPVHGHRSSHSSPASSAAIDAPRNRVARKNSGARKPAPQTSPGGFDTQMQSVHRRPSHDTRRNGKGGHVMMEQNQQ